MTNHLSFDFFNLLFFITLQITARLTPYTVIDLFVFGQPDVE